MKKTNKAILVLIAGILITSFSMNSVSAAYGQGQGKGTGQGMGQNAQTNFVDTNNNGIADGQEDFDNDGIINRDDEDYEKTYTNMRDDDNDGIPNKDDEDYTRVQDGTNRPANVGNVNTVRGQGSTFQNTTLKTEYKNTYEIKYGAAISRMSDDQLTVFISKIDDLVEKVNIGDYSDETKVKFNAMLDALKEIAEDNMDENNILDGLFE